MTVTHAEPFPGDPPVTDELVREHNLNEQEYARIRAMLGDLRSRVKEVPGEVPEAHTRVVMYVGQSVINEGNERGE